MNHTELAGRFNAAFAAPWRRPPAGRCAAASGDALAALAPTRLIGGAAEPSYLPAAGGRPAVIRYTRDYAQSVLHEIAHWCVADAAQRELADYGLHYCPPPRGDREQAEFYAAEVPVQALEMLLARACGLPFHFSADNPGADLGPARSAFEHQVRARCRLLCRCGPGALACRVLDVIAPAPRVSCGAADSTP